LVFNKCVCIPASMRCSMVGKRFLMRTLVAWKTMRLPRVRYLMSVLRINLACSSAPSIIVLTYNITLQCHITIHSCNSISLASVSRLHDVTISFFWEIFVTCKNVWNFVSALNNVMLDKHVNIVLRTGLLKNGIVQNVGYILSNEIFVPIRCWVN